MAIKSRLIKLKKTDAERTLVRGFAADAWRLKSAGLTREQIHKSVKKVKAVKAARRQKAVWLEE